MREVRRLFPGPHVVRIHLPQQHQGRSRRGIHPRHAAGSEVLLARRTIRKVRDSDGPVHKHPPEANEAYLLPALVQPFRHQGLLDLRPILLRVDDLGRAFFEAVCCTRIVAQIELALDDPPRLWIDVRGDRSERNPVGAVAPILRGVFDRLYYETIAILSACEIPGGPQPVMTKIWPSLPGPGFE